MVFLPQAEDSRLHKCGASENSESSVVFQALKVLDQKASIWLMIRSIKDYMGVGGWYDDDTAWRLVGPLAGSSALCKLQLCAFY